MTAKEKKLSFHTLSLEMRVRVQTGCRGSMEGMLSSLQLKGTSWKVKVWIVSQLMIYLRYIWVIHKHAYLPTHIPRLHPNPKALKHDLRLLQKLSITPSAPPPPHNVCTPSQLWFSHFCSTSLNNSPEKKREDKDQDKRRTTQIPNMPVWKSARMHRSYCTLLDRNRATQSTWMHQPARPPAHKNLNHSLNTGTSVIELWFLYGV